MSMLPTIKKENADEKARRVRLLRIWTDICAMALCEMPEGRSENQITLDVGGGRNSMHFLVVVRGKMVEVVRASDTDAEDKLADIRRRLKPYVA